MSADQVERKLAAILAADVEGYSSLMSADEVGTLRMLTAYRRIIDGLIALRRGRVFNTAGDSVLAEFASVVDAVQCAVDVQHALAEQNEGRPAEKRMRFRIGVHVGDVLLQAGDLFGDGVNIAARLESLAEPGGVCISEQVRDYLGHKLPLSFTDCGKQRVKNIPDPVHAYQIGTGATPTAVPIQRPALTLPDKPSIAVLPFVNLSGDLEQEYFVDGIVEDIITALSKIRWFFVIARNSTFAYKGKSPDIRQVGRELGVRYVLEGSVRKLGNRMRVTAQLVDAATGNHIWAERYDEEVADIFVVQDQITERVAGAIEPELLKVEGERAAITRSTTNVTAWDLVRQGMWYFHKVSRPTHLRARELFREAIKLDGQLTEAHAWLGRVAAGVVPYGWSEDPASDLAEGLRAARRAIQLDAKNPYSQYSLAITSVYLHAFDQAIRAAETSTEIAPSFALGYLVLGMARLFSGNAVEAIEPLQHGLRLSPYDPQNFVWYRLLALAHYFNGQAEQALASTLKAMKSRPSWPPSLETAVICCVALGRMVQARELVGELTTLERPSADVLEPLRKHNPHWADEMSAMLRKAGVPQ
jgi:adenylate cyclase